MADVPGGPWLYGDSAGLPFEVVIKRNHSMSRAIRNRVTSGKVVIENQSIRQVIQEYYRLKEFELTGAIPAWMNSERYDITITSKVGTTWTQMQGMVQKVLTNRFSLKFHKVTVEMQGWSLFVERDGPRFHEYRSLRDDDERSTGERQEHGRITGRRMVMRHFADYLSTVMQTPVLDSTNLAGEYEIAFSYHWADGQGGSAGAAAAAMSGFLREQLGLGLRMQRMTVEIVAIDSINRPLEN